MALKGLIALLAMPWLVQPATAVEGFFPKSQLQQIQSGIDMLYSLDYVGAVDVFSDMVLHDDTDPAGYTYLAYAYWLREMRSAQESSIDRFTSSDFLSESPTYRPSVPEEREARFRRTTERAIDLSQDRLEANPKDDRALYLLGFAYQTLAAYEASLKRSWWSAIINGTKTFRYHEDLVRRHPGLADPLLALGVSHYAYGRLSWKLKWLAFTLGYRGSAERGKRELKEAAERGTLVANDARVMLAFIYAHEHDYQASFAELEKLYRKYPRNFLLALDMAGLAVRLGKVTEAITMYEDLAARRAEFPGLEAGMLSNRIGMAYRAAGNWDKARDSFQQALREEEGTGRSATAARLELAKTFDLMGRRAAALELYRKVEADMDYAGSRLEARRLIEKPYRGEGSARP